MVGFLGLFVFVVVSNDINQIDLNPSFNDSDIIGDWKDGDSYIQLKPDQTVHFTFGERYRARMGIVSGDGHWHKQGDFNIRITDANSEKSLPMLRVIKIRDKYRLKMEVNDPDLYDYRWVFKRSSFVE